MARGSDFFPRGGGAGVCLCHGRRPTSFRETMPRRGEMAGRSVNGARTDYLLSGDQKVGEYNASGALLRRFLWGPAGPDDIVALMTAAGSPSGRRRFHHLDGLGSTVALTDSTGAVVERYPATAFGVGDVNTGITPWRFRGRRLDPETGFYHLRARDYAPMIGRFVQPDPIGMAGGINLYAYVGNDPLNRTDPWGLWTLQIGFNFSVSLGRFGISGGVGVVIDSQGNAGRFFTVPRSPYVEPSFGGGIILGFGASFTPGATTIHDVEGPGRTQSFAIGRGIGVSLDIGESPTTNGILRSYGATVGVGLGIGYSSTNTTTEVLPIFTAPVQSPSSYRTDNLSSFNQSAQQHPRSENRNISTSIAWK
jgi:RHS repeat-associated protein